jgi:polyhydroxybutyrate depolymerase
VKHTRFLGTAVAAFLATAQPLDIARAAQPDSLKGSVSVNVGKIAGHDRRYIEYAPAALQPGAPLVFVFHGGGGDGPLIRESTGFEFDMLADQFGFVVAYPDGVGRGWNSCRKRVASEAKQLRIDDVAFIEAIIAHEAAAHGIDVKRVFATGHSFGGQISYRLALERPNEFAGIAAISANLPAPTDNDCAIAAGTIPVMVMNGTDDPVSPYRGGRTGRGIDSGNSLSTEATVEYFVRRNGIAAMPEVTRLPHVSVSDPTWVERITWDESGKPPVILYTIHGGGHVVPQPYFRFPTVVGRQTKDLDAPAVIWDFFSHLPARP